jgi:acyl dehydratase
MEIETPDWKTLKEQVGRELGLTGWLAIEQGLIDRFADCTGDRQWIHVDVERARRESPAGSTIAHGYLLLALLARFSFELRAFPRGTRNVLNYGLDRVRFVSPVKAGARVRDRVVLLGVEERGPGRVLLKTRHTLEIDGEEKPAMVAESLSLLIGDERAR